MSSEELLKRSRNPVERKGRLTASMLAKIVKSRDLKKTAVAIENNWNRLPTWDSPRKSIVIKAYEKHTGRKVSPCGIILDLDVAACPDGIVEGGGIIKIEYPHASKMRKIVKKKRKLKRGSELYYNVK